MPNIPIVRVSPVVNAAAPVLDRERRPTVDTRGQQQAIGQLAKSAQMPDLPQSLAEPYSALGAVGRAVAQGGNLLSALAIKQREAESDVQIAEADNVMLSERAGFEEWKMNNPDPSTWKPEWEGRLTGIQKRFTENAKLHPGAREQIGMRMERYTGQSLADVSMGAAKETFARAKSAFVATVDSATETQDVARFEDSLQTAAAKGYLYPHEVENAKQRFVQRGKQLKQEAESDAFESARNQVAALTQEAGAEVTINNIKGGAFGVFGEFDQERLSDLARNMEAQTRTQFAGDLANALAAGEIDSEAKIKELAGKNPRLLTPVLQEKLTDALRTENVEKMRIEREQNGVKNAVELRQRVNAYDPKKDASREKYFELVRDIGTKVDQSMAGEITSELYKKYGATPPNLKVRPEIAQNISKSLDVLFDAKQGAIPWQVESVVRDAKGKPVKDSNGNIKMTTKEDSAAHQRALDAQTVIEIKMSDWMKANPVDAQSLPAVKKKLQEFLPEGTRAGALEALMKAAPKAQTKMSSPNRAAVDGALPTDGALVIDDPLQGDILPPLGTL